MEHNPSLWITLWLRRMNEWKVFDIVIEGVSLVTNYRSQFASEIKIMESIH